MAIVSIDLRVADLQVWFAQRQIAGSVRWRRKERPLKLKADTLGVRATNGDEY